MTRREEKNPRQMRKLELMAELLKSRGGTRKGAALRGGRGGGGRGEESWLNSMSRDKLIEEVENRRATREEQERELRGGDDGGVDGW